MPLASSDRLNNYVFLLGGHDLEMMEIKSMLVGVAKTVDNNLKWGAKLSSYRTEFDDKHIFVGIELEKDCKPPVNYIEIDHHNEKSENPSSIEQIAELLELDLSPWQKLVAINDKSHIPGLEKAGADNDEILRIRKADRKAQGVTARDEQLAEISIENQLSKFGKLTIVHSLTSHFSAITDRLYPYSELLIVHEKSFTYYGKNATILSSKYSDLQDKKIAYSGGNPPGFFGIDGSKLDNQEFNHILNSVIQYLRTMEKISQHIFIFPFRWSAYTREKKNQETESFKPSPDLISQIFSAPWERDSDDSELIKLYNESKYYHNFVYPALFDSLIINKQKVNNSVWVRKFKYNFDENKIGDDKRTYNISIRKRERENIKEMLLREDYFLENKGKYNFTVETFSLYIEKISLLIYSEGIGILAFHLDNYKYKSPEEILLINQFGRRIYPPFFDNHYRDFEIGLTNELEGTQHREMPVDIAIPFLEGYDKENTAFSMFLESEKVDNKTKQKVRLTESNICAPWPYFITDLLKAKTTEKFELKIQTKYEVSKKEVDFLIKPFLDDRMFVMCWYGAYQLTNEFKRQKKSWLRERNEEKYVLSDICRRSPGGYEVTGFYRNDLHHKSLALNKSHDSYGYASNDFWYQYMFVDGAAPSIANSLMQIRLAEDHTYARWVENNTLYGITRYSFVCLTEPVEQLWEPKVNVAFIPEHFGTLYFMMVCHNIAQRARILDFSEKISEILKENEGRNERQKALALYKDYRSYINNFYYREVSSQEQAIELYELIQKHFRIKEQSKELDNEFIEMNRLTDMIGTNTINRRTRVLTVIGSVFALFTVVFGWQNATGFRNLSYFTFEKWTAMPVCWNCIFTIVMLGTTAYFLINSLLLWNYKEKNKIWKAKYIFLFLALLYFILYTTTYYLKLTFINSIQPDLLKLGIISFLTIILVRLTLRQTFFKNKNVG